MKPLLQWGLLVLLLVITVGGATVLYRQYGDAYGGGNLVVSPEFTSHDRNTAAAELSSDDAEDTRSDADSAVLSEPQESGETLNRETIEWMETTDKVETTEIGMKSPDFTVLDANGNAVSLSDYIGQPIVLNFWATWCGYCKLEMPDFDNAARENPDVVFLMVNATDGIYETVDSAKAYIEKEGFTFTVLYDTREEAVSAYHITAFPQTVFIDREGNIVATARGMLSKASLDQGIAMIK
jgi:peroxiredoxin